MKKIIIYALIDPRDNEIRYIGKTNQILSYRLSAHLREKLNCHRCHWINQLQSVGLKPIIKPIDEIPPERSWQEAERFWIKYFKIIGCKLTNNTSGGDGVPDLPKETRDRVRLAWFGKKHTPETIEKFKHRRPADYKHPEETKEKIRKAMIGRTITWKDKIALTNRKITAEQAISIKKRLESGEMVKDLAIEFFVHRTTLTKINMGEYFLPYRRDKKGGGL